MHKLDSVRHPDGLFSTFLFFCKESLQDVLVKISSNRGTKTRKRQDRGAGDRCSHVETYEHELLRLFLLLLEDWLQGLQLCPKSSNLLVRLIQLMQPCRKERPLSLQLLFSLVFQLQSKTQPREDPLKSSSPHVSWRLEERGISKKRSRDERRRDREEKGERRAASLERK